MALTDKYIRYTGKFLFLAGFFLFNLTLFTGRYRITNDTLALSGLNEEMITVLINEIGPLPADDLSKPQIIKITGTAIRKANKLFRQENKSELVVYNVPETVFNISKSGMTGFPERKKELFSLLVFTLTIAGALMIFAGNTEYNKPGIRNNGIFVRQATGRGFAGYALAAYLLLFYTCLYFVPAWITEPVALTDPISMWITGQPAGRWFMYGFLYTVFILVMGIRFILRYRYNRYQVWRTVSVIFFQTIFAFTIPQILTVLNQPYMDFKNIWPLDYSFFFSYRIGEYINAGTIGYFMIGWGIMLIIIAVPVLTYFFGKRWYCSWVCGCGGLAETAGDPFRHLSNKSLRAWKFERVSIYSVMIFAFAMTAVVIASLSLPGNKILGLPAGILQGIYGFLVGSVLAGVIGTGFYPIMGNRVWCRFFCPLAAYLGIVQRFRSRFRITTNGGQCISCGNCSAYCEMGIDVRAYAQKGQNIVRASCVGCGICSAVCPRGVLKLENGPVKERIKINPVLTGNLNDIP